MNDLSTLTGSGRVFRLGGEEHKVFPLTLEDWAGMQAWVDRQFPDPFEVVSAAIDAGRVVTRDGKATREPYTVTQQQFMLRMATEQATRARRLIGACPEADDLLQSMEGIKQLLLVSIRKGNAAFSAEDADRLYRKMTFVDVARVLKETNAELVVNADPKAEPGTTTGGTTTPS